MHRGVRLTRTCGGATHAALLPGAFVRSRGGFIPAKSEVFDSSGEFSAAEHVGNSSALMEKHFSSASEPQTRLK